MDIWSLPGAKQLRHSTTLNTFLRLGHGQYWGCFPSRDSAEVFLKTSKSATYDDDEIVQINLENFQNIHLFDWPVIFHLQKMIGNSNLKVVTDFGGHVGAKYHAYRSVLDMPSDLVWQVVDVPAVCREGRRRLGRNDTNPIYFENIAETPACDALLCSGSLPYADEFLDQIINKMTSKPEFVIVNKLSISKHAFYTLEAFGRKRMPHRIVTAHYLKNIREKLGYSQIAHWDIPHRKFTVSHQKGATEVETIGQVWQR